MRRYPLILLALALTFSACDTSSGEGELAPTATVADAESWYLENARPASDNARTSDPVTRILERYRPDWNTGKVVTDGNGGTYVVSVLGPEASESPDPNTYIVRTLVVAIDSEHRPTSGHIVEYTSPQEEWIESASDMTRRWATGSFDDHDVSVSEYTIDYQPVKSTLYMAGNAPVEGTIELVECETGGADHGRMAVRNCYQTGYSFATCSGGVADDPESTGLSLSLKRRAFGLILILLRATHKVKTMVTQAAGDQAEEEVGAAGDQAGDQDHHLVVLLTIGMMSGGSKLAFASSILGDASKLDKWHLLLMPLRKTTLYRH